MAALFSRMWSLFTFRLTQSGHTAREIMDASFEASRTRDERFETTDRLRQLVEAFAMQATQNGLALKKKQREPTPAPTPSSKSRKPNQKEIIAIEVPPSKTRKSNQQECIAVEVPNVPRRVLSPLSLRNTNVPLNRQKRAVTFQHPGLCPEVHGKGSLTMVAPKRMLSPQEANNQRSVRSGSTFT